MKRSCGQRDHPTPDIRTLALSGIVIEPAVQVRVATRWATVREYQEAMKAGAVFQAVTVTPIDDADLSKGFVLLDGHHRFHATAALGLTSINAEVVYGLAREGWRWAGVQRNRTHGLRYTMAERREQFRAYIEAGNHRIGKRGIKSARQMANELGGIVSDRRLPEWMKQDFPSIYRMMIARKMIAQPTADFGRKDMDPTLAQIAASNLDQFMAAFRGIKNDDLRATMARNIMGVAQMAAKAAEGGSALPPVEIPEDEF